MLWLKSINSDVENKRLTSSQNIPSLNPLEKKRKHKICLRTLCIFHAQCFKRKNPHYQWISTDFYLHFYFYFSTLNAEQRKIIGFIEPLNVLVRCVDHLCCSILKFRNLG